MAENITTISQVVLQRGTTTMGYTEFDPPELADGPFLTLDRVSWAAMGEPDTVTVTIAVGDQLNP